MSHEVSGFFGQLWMQDISPELLRCLKTGFTLWVVRPYISKQTIALGKILLDIDRTVANKGMTGLTSIILLHVELMKDASQNIVTQTCLQWAPCFNIFPQSCQQQLKGICSQAIVIMGRQCFCFQLKLKWTSLYARSFCV